MGYYAKSFVTLRKWFMLAPRIFCMFGTWVEAGAFVISGAAESFQCPRNGLLLTASPLYLVLPDNPGTVQSNLFSYHFLHACKHNMHHRESQSWAKEVRGWFNAGDWFICFGGWKTIIPIGRRCGRKLGEWGSVWRPTALHKWVVNDSKATKPRFSYSSLRAVFQFLSTLQKTPNPSLKQ